MEKVQKWKIPNSGAATIFLAPEVSFGINYFKKLQTYFIYQL